MTRTFPSTAGVISMARPGRSRQPSHRPNAPNRVRAQRPPRFHIVWAYSQLEQPCDPAERTALRGQHRYGVAIRNGKGDGALRVARVADGRDLIERLACAIGLDRDRIGRPAQPVRDDSPRVGRASFGRLFLRR